MAWYKVELLIYSLLLHFQVFYFGNYFFFDLILCWLSYFILFKELLFDLNLLIEFVFIFLNVFDSLLFPLIMDNWKLFFIFTPNSSLVSEELLFLVHSLISFFYLLLEYLFILFLILKSDSVFLFFSSFEFNILSFNVPYIVSLDFFVFIFLFLEDLLALLQHRVDFILFHFNLHSSSLILLLLQFNG